MLVLKFRALFFGTQRVYGLSSLLPAHWVVMRRVATNEAERPGNEAIPNEAETWERGYRILPSKRPPPFFDDPMVREYMCYTYKWLLRVNAHPRFLTCECQAPMGA